MRLCEAEEEARREVGVGGETRMGCPPVAPRPPKSHHRAAALRHVSRASDVDAHAEAKVGDCFVSLLALSFVGEWCDFKGEGAALHLKSEARAERRAGRREQ